MPEPEDTNQGSDEAGPSGSGQEPNRVGLPAMLDASIKEAISLFQPKFKIKTREYTTPENIIALALNKPATVKKRHPTILGLFKAIWAKKNNIEFNMKSPSA